MMEAVEVAVVLSSMLNLSQTSTLPKPTSLSSDSRSWAVGTTSTSHQHWLVRQHTATYNGLSDDGRSPGVDEPTIAGVMHLWSI